MKKKEESEKKVRNVMKEREQGDNYRRVRRGGGRQRERDRETERETKRERTSLKAVLFLILLRNLRSAFPCILYLHTLS